MIVLSTTNDNLLAVLGGTVTTNQLQCFTSWRDRTSTTYAADRTVVNTNNTTDVIIAAAPAASTQRIVDFISVFNTDTVNAEVTIKFNLSGTDYILFKTTLASGEKLEYQEGHGFKVIANSGAVKQSINQGNNTIGSDMTAVVLGSDVINAHATPNTMLDVTGLSFSVTSGKTYYFKFIIPYDSAATTTGSRWSIDGPAAPTFLCYSSEYSLAATTTTSNANLTGYDLPAACNATSSSTPNCRAIIIGMIKPSANGTVIARFASEVTLSAITAKAGALVYYQETL
jgi:hypothetical protein